MNEERTGKHYFSYVHDDIKLITNESFGLTVLLDQASGCMLSLAQGKWEETVTTGILCHSTSYHRYPLMTNNCLSEVFPKTLTPLNTPMVDICIYSSPTISVQCMPLWRGVYPTNRETISHFYILGNFGVGKKLMIQKNVHKLWFFYENIIRYMNFFFKYLKG